MATRLRPPGGQDRWLLYTVTFLVVATAVAVGLVTGVALLIG